MVSIADACELVTDGTHYTPKDVGQGIPFLTVKDVTDARLDFTNCSFISEADFLAAKAGNSAPMNGDVLFSKDGTVGKVHVITTDQPFAVLSSLAILRPKRGHVDSGYLGHVLRSPSVLDDALKKKTGSAIRRIVLGDLKRVRLPLPPLPEQRRIAAILDQADTLRTQRRAALAQLDELTQSLFLDMFGDPARNTLSLPTAALGDLGDWHSGGTPPRGSQHFFEGNIPWFSSGELESMYVSDSAEHISADAIRQTSAKLVPAGSLMLGMYDTAALKASIATRDASCNQAIAFSKIRSDRAHPIYVYFAIVVGREHFKRLQRGVRQKNLNLSMVREIRIPSPPLPLQHTFATRVQAIEALKAQHRAALAEADALFASLQQRAFAGKL